MEAIKAVESLIWKKSQLEKFEDWLEDIEVYNQPVNGVYWRNLKKLLQNYSEEMKNEIEEIEQKINKAIGETNIDI
ncbi:hypothetical protein AAGG74_15210 [Bacillus mexicanus]|uniref:hypothetical protein n=1 Tax=Bacillus mexicanus TaxID=2834415 RepID=UPI003D1968C4